MVAALAAKPLDSESDSGTNSDEEAAVFVAVEMDAAVCGHLGQARGASGNDALGGDFPITVEELPFQVGEVETESWYFDTGAVATCHTSGPSEGSLHVADGVILPIEEQGNLVVDFQSGKGSVCAKLLAAYAPSLSYHSLSQRMAVK